MPRGNTGYYNNTVNVVSTVHCLFGGVAPAVHCRARCRKSRKKRRGARLMQHSSSSRRRGDRRAAAAGHGTAARRSRAAATAAHPTTPSAAPRRPSVAPGLCARICSLSALTSATQAQAAAGGANSASHRTWRSVRAGAQAPASTSRQLRRGQIPGERRRRRPGLPGDTAAASLRTKSARVLPALASSGRTSTSSARISTGPARC